MAIDLDILDKLSQDPQYFWVLYDYCIENNLATPEPAAFPIWLYEDRKDKIYFTIGLGHSSQGGFFASLCGLYCASRLNRGITNEGFGSTHGFIFR